MIPPGSRYESSERLFSEAHSYNEFGYPFLEGESPNLKIKVLNRETLYGPLPQPYPYIPTISYYVKTDESPQWLAYKFLGDAKRWHEIADRNRNVWYPLDLRQGDYIGIPIEQ
jgi:hypothetical protein